MKNGNLRFRGFGRSLAVLVTLSGVLLLATSTATAQDFPGEIIGVGELPPILSGPYRIQVGDVLDIQFFKTIELNQTRTVGPGSQYSACCANNRGSVSDSQATTG